MNENDEKPFLIEYAKTGRAACKKCKEKCDVKQLRMAKVVSSPYGSGKMNNWYHIDCIFETFKTQRASTKSIECVDDIGGWETITDSDQNMLIEKLKQLPSYQMQMPCAVATSASNKNSNNNNNNSAEDYEDRNYKESSNDNSFRQFRKICADLSEESSYLGKTAILHKFFLLGTNGKCFQGKLYTWIKMLLPGTDRRVYNLQSKQLIKLFSKIFHSNIAEMLEHLEQGYIDVTISEFFQSSEKVLPSTTSSMSLEHVDRYLEELSQLTREEDQIIVFKKICRSSTATDLQMIIRLIKHDIRINAGPKHILEALSKDAYPAYQLSRDLRNVVRKFGNKIAENKLDLLSGSTKAIEKNQKGGIQLMVPVSPMLADACKSVEKAIIKCPAGIYSEIKYDGERVQLHKKGNEFKFFSRNLKPVLDHKIKGCKAFISQAFPTANDLILDSEIITIDSVTGELLPFGMLGKHKKAEHSTAEVCLFIFDCIYYNGMDLTKKTMKERRQILEDNICPIKNHIQLSEYHLIKSSKELNVMIAKVLQMGLEGLVLKNINGIYEPGKRHWLKMKKDYLFDGQMADAADLVMLGAWFGTGKKGGMLSVFLMGCFDAHTKRWKTVTKVHTGLDDKTLNEMQKILTPRMHRADPESPPQWLICKKPMIPDMLANNPADMPVWEITGAEFTRSDIHTADGISIRFPRITRQRTDKSPADATTLADLNRLYDSSKGGATLQMLTDAVADSDAIDIKTKLHGIGSLKKNIQPELNGNKEKVHKRSISNEHNDDDDDDDDSKQNEIAAKRSKIECQSTAVAKKKSNQSKSDKNRPQYMDSSSDMDKMNGLLLADNTVKNAEPAIINSLDDKRNQFVPNAAEYNLFDGIRLYVPSDVRDKVVEQLRYFHRWGGIESQLPQNCTHALHKENVTIDNWSLIRQKYMPSCRHVQYTWLVKSINRKVVEDIINHSIVLKTYLES